MASVGNEDDVQKSPKKISKLFGPIFNDSQRTKRIFGKSGNVNHPTDHSQNTDQIHRKIQIRDPKFIDLNCQYYWCYYPCPHAVKLKVPARGDRGHTAM